MKLACFGFIISVCMVPISSYGWTSTDTYTDSAHHQLQYVIAAPAVPAAGQKWPVIFFEPGDGTNMAQDAFSPNQMGPMMEQLAQAANAVLVVGELRRQLFVGNSTQICELDFNHRVGDLGSLVDQVKTLPFIDATKVILFAHSAGGETVTKLAGSRSDIRGVFTVSTGVVSCSEDDSSCPFNASQMQAIYDYICQSSGDNGREGLWWQQLFQESHLRGEIEQLNVPYKAVVGSQDAQISVASSQTAQVAISSRKSDFEFQIVQGADHGSALTNPATIGALIQFVKKSVGR